MHISDGMRLYLNISVNGATAPTALPVNNNLAFFFITVHITVNAHRAGSDGSMSASGSAGLGFDPRRDSKFSFENFQPRG